MTLGAEPKKLAMLGGLVLVGGYLFYSNVLSGPDVAPQTRPSAPAGGNVSPVPIPPRAQPPARRDAQRSTAEFRPTLKRKPDERIDPMTVDPTLRLDMLSKVQAVGPEGGTRNLFQFSAPPAPAAPAVPVAKGPVILPKSPQQAAQEEAAKRAASEPPKPPPPPPIPLKYYGYSTLRRDGVKRAFFLDGEDILIAAEGEMVKRRYRVVRIGVNSVVMEDIDSKNQQTLPLTEEAAG